MQTTYEKRHTAGAGVAGGPHMKKKHTAIIACCNNVTIAMVFLSGILAHSASAQWTSAPSSSSGDSSHLRDAPWNFELVNVGDLARSRAGVFEYFILGDEPIFLGLVTDGYGDYVDVPVEITVNGEPYETGMMLLEQGYMNIRARYEDPVIGDRYLRESYRVKQYEYVDVNPYLTAYDLQPNADGTFELDATIFMDSDLVGMEDINSASLNLWFSYSDEEEAGGVGSTRLWVTGMYPTGQNDPDPDQAYVRLVNGGEGIVMRFTGTVPVDDFVNLRVSGVGIGFPDTYMFNDFVDLEFQQFDDDGWGEPGPREEDEVTTYEPISCMIVDDKVLEIDGFKSPTEHGKDICVFGTMSSGCMPDSPLPCKTWTRKHAAKGMSLKAAGSYVSTIDGQLNKFSGGLVYGSPLARNCTNGDEELGPAPLTGQCGFFSEKQQVWLACFTDCEFNAYAIVDGSALFQSSVSAENSYLGLFSSAAAATGGTVDIKVGKLPSWSDVGVASVRTPQATLRINFFPPGGGVTVPLKPLFIPTVTDDIVIDSEDFGPVALKGGKGSLNYLFNGSHYMETVADGQHKCVTFVFGIIGDWVWSGQFLLTHHGIARSTTPEWDFTVSYRFDPVDQSCEDSPEPIYWP
jgi:hypothetical protein